MVIGLLCTKCKIMLIYCFQARKVTKIFTILGELSFILQSHLRQQQYFIEYFSRV